MVSLHFLNSIISLFMLINFHMEKSFGSNYGYCYSAHQCENTQINHVEYLYCFGLQSCENIQKANVSYGIYCDGSESCLNTSIITQYSYCDGYYSCLNSTSTSISKYCYGEGSCLDTTIILEAIYRNIFQCYGLSACSFSTISYQSSSTGYFHGYGPYSLYNSTINISNMDGRIYLYGYFAGYNAHIICNNECSIDCFGHGCFNTYVDCTSLSRDDCDVFCDPDNGDDCPIGYYNGTNHYYNSSYYNHVSNNLLSKITLENENNTNHICWQDSNNPKRCDNRMGCYYDTINNRNGSICCEGYHSCYGANLITSSDIRCDAGYSCYLSTILSNKNVYCTSQYSCYYALINVTLNNNNNGIISCNGYRSCYYATIYNGNKVVCNGVQSCYLTTIYSINDVYVYGCNGAYGAAITSSNKGSIMKVYFCGYNSGYNVRISCQKRDFCDVYCISSNTCPNGHPTCTGYCRIIYNQTLVDEYCAENAPSFSYVSQLLSSDINLYNGTGIDIENKTTNNFTYEIIDMPSSDPTNIPTLTKNTNNPTYYPTTFPTLTSTNKVTNKPVKNPTSQPINFNYTITPATESILETTQNQTDEIVINKGVESGTTGNDGNSDSMFSTGGLVIIIVMIFLLLIVIIGIVCYYKRKIQKIQYAQVETVNDHKIDNDINNTINNNATKS